MNVKDIAELIKVIDSTSLDYVKLEDSSLKLEVSRNNMIVDNNKTCAKNQGIEYIEENLHNSSTGSDSYNGDFEIEESAYTNSSCDLFDVKAPLMGTFYASPSPDAGTYVKIGDTVEEGQTLCILEAMKLMNEIQSDVSGEIVEILVQNEELVEYNQPIFRIKPVK
ncbi:MAG: acetyl-CoA carboxylase biotin carboxyl carrier protein [Clostridioides sp.]|jgi:acetyl-CoA carboxylase biotin carboxyl carrier protein|nr:acetyl-CoA carboxylase biotin carboxyl carrier protein [Clostridioides sp.]